MDSPAKDHRRAYSPHFPVTEGQRYRIECSVYCSSVNAGTIGLYTSCYTNTQATGKGLVGPIRTASNMIGRWEVLNGVFTVLAGVHSMKILVWSSSNSEGTFFVDDVQITPL